MIHRIRTILAMSALLYASIVLIAQLTNGGQAIYGQRIDDVTRRVESIERMGIGERLARIETQLEAAAHSAERTGNLATGALVCLLGLTGETLIRLLRGGREKS